jgi:hypothetical protein
MLSGDGTIVARIVSLSSSAASAGVMIRESLTAASTHIYPSFYQHAVYMNYRLTSGGSTGQGSGGAAMLPYWVKAVRSGSTLSGYASLDGVNWELISSQSISMAQNVYIGLAVCSANNSSLATATFDNVSVSTAATVAPEITELSATTGSVGAPLQISGSGFGATQGNSEVLLNDTAVTVNSWSDSSISASIPSGASSGPLVVSVAPNMNDSNPVTFTVTSQPLPSPWLDQDVGQVGIAGSATFSNGTFTVNGAGTSAWNTADGVHLVYQPLSGDGSIVARVVSVSSGFTGGVMIRDTLNANAMSTFVAPYNSRVLALRDVM